MFWYLQSIGITLIVVTTTTKFIPMPLSYEVQKHMLCFWCWCWRFCISKQRICAYNNTFVLFQAPRCGSSWWALSIESSRTLKSDSNRIRLPKLDFSVFPFGRQHTRFHFRPSTHSQLVERKTMDLYSISWRNILVSNSYPSTFTSSWPRNTQNGLTR